MDEKKLSFGEKLKLNIRGIKLIRQLLPWRLYLDLFMGLSGTALSYWKIIFLAKFVDDVTASADEKTLLLDVAFMLLGDLALHIIFLLFQYMYYYLGGTSLWERANTHLNRKVMDMDYQYMESETIMNKRRDIAEVARTLGGGMNTLFWNIYPIIARTMMMVVAFVYIFVLVGRGASSFGDQPWQAVLLFLGFTCLFAGLLYLNLRKNKQIQRKQFALNDEVVPLAREYMFYIWDYISGAEAAKDIRVFHQQNLLSQHLIGLFEEIELNNEAQGRLEEKRYEWAGITEAVLTSLIYFLLGIMVLKNAISIGSICLYSGCIANLLWNFHNWVAQITLVLENSKYLKQYFDFLDIPNLKYEGTLPVEKRNDDKFTIEFKNVSFKYPGTDTYTLRNFSIKFNIGERLAVVGKNGSGKTTFIKLLCRLYDPTEGEILLNGIDVRKYDYQEYLSMFSVVFQDFQIPSLPLGQTVAVSEEYDAEAVADALKKAGLEEFLEKLPKGLDTCLYTDLDNDGVAISGGEAQKIAIARALYHDSPFIVLDEPTSALDPLAEYEVYSKFDQLVGTKTAVYISHRLSSCRFCNDILVIDDGKAIQRGNHEKLIEDKDGLYFKLFHTQAQYYEV